MTDTVETPVQQAQAPVQQVQTTSASPAEDWKKRYDGQVRTIEQLVGEKRTLETELANLRAENERLSAQLGIKDAEKSAAVGERDKQLQSYIQKATETDAELARLRALELKVKTATKLGNPALLQVAETIPDITDPAALEVVMTNLNNFVAGQVKAREQQLMAGVAPAGGLTQTVSATPSTDEAWKRYIEEIPFTEPAKRQRALDDYGKWLQQTHQGR